MKKKSAFTMMEMVLVMTVIIALFLLTIPNIKQTMGLIHDKSCDAQLKVVDGAIVQYFIKNDDYAQSIDDLIDDDLITERQSRCPDGSAIEVIDGQAKKS